MKTAIALALVTCSLAACGGYGRSAMHVASLDHDCPEERITMIELDGTTAVLDVCGRRRVYRDTAGSINPATWGDVTATTQDCGGGQTPPPPEPEPAPAPEPEPAPAPTPEPTPIPAAADPTAPVPTPVAPVGA